MPKRTYGYKSVSAKINAQNSAITNGVHQSNVSQLKKISKVKITVELPQVPLIDLYMRVKGVWQHKGKSCGHCGVLINDPVVIDKHRYICKEINKKKNEEL